MLDSFYYDITNQQRRQFIDGEQARYRPMPGTAASSWQLHALRSSSRLDAAGKSRWNRSALIGALVKTGDVVTICKDGLVRLM